MKLGTLALFAFALAGSLAVGGLAEGTAFDLAPTAAAGEVCRSLPRDGYVCVWCPDELCPPWH